MKFEDWDFVDHNKFLHLVTKKLMRQKIDAMVGMIKLELCKWLKGVEEVRLLNLL